MPRTAAAAVAPALTLLLAALAGSVALSPATARGGDGPYPEVGALRGDPLADAYGRGGFLATAAGPTTGLILPAALAWQPRARSVAQLDLVEGHLAGGLFAWQPGRLALGYRHVDSRVLGHDEDHYLLSLARSRPGSVWGTELAWFRNDVAGGADALSWSTSMAFRPTPRLSVAARLLHLNRPRFLDDRLRRTVALGFAIGAAEQRLTLATDFFVRDDGADDLLVRYGAELEPADGVHVGIAIDNEGGFRLALALRDEQNQIGYGYGSESSGRHRQTLHLGYEEQRSSGRQRPTGRRR